MYNVLQLPVIVREFIRLLCFLNVYQVFFYLQFIKYDQFPAYFPFVIIIVVPSYRQNIWVLFKQFSFVVKVTEDHSDIKDVLSIAKSAMNPRLFIG